MAQGPKLAVILRKAQRRVSIADEHDYEAIEGYCTDLDREHGTQSTVLRPAQRPSVDAFENWDGFVFVGADEYVRQFIERAAHRRPVFLWAKGYDLTLDGSWLPRLDSVERFFNSSYLSAVDDRLNDRTDYLPTAFHDRWPWTFGATIDDARNRLVDVESFDLVFSGSNRHVRPDRYRQRLLNLLARRGLKMLIAAPQSVWTRAHRHDTEQEPLDTSIRMLGNWGTERTFWNARCLLDLPWLDNWFEIHPSHHDPNHSVFALGWNIFRAGAYGARLLTYDCPANRQLGLSEESCVFYRSGLEDLDAMADEIAECAGKCGSRQRVDRRPPLKTLFHTKHTYRERWQHIYRVVSRYYRTQSASNLASLGASSVA